MNYYFGIKLAEHASLCIMVSLISTVFIYHFSETSYLQYVPDSLHAVATQNFSKSTHMVVSVHEVFVSSVLHIQGS